MAPELDRQEVRLAQGGFGLLMFAVEFLDADVDLLRRQSRRTLNEKVSWYNY